MSRASDKVSMTQPSLSRIGGVSLRVQAIASGNSSAGTPADGLTRNCVLACPPLVAHHGALRLGQARRTHLTRVSMSKGPQIEEIEAILHPEGWWGVKVRPKAGDPITIMAPTKARDDAVAAQQRGDENLAKRLLDAANEASRKNNKLDANGVLKGWTTTPPELERGD
jgi:hypothetical protein